MKLEIPLVQNADPRFVSVARAIAKTASPPDWLTLALTHFGTFVGSEPSDKELRKWGHRVCDDCLRAVDVLMRWLPTFNHLPLSPDPAISGDTLVVLDALPRIKKGLERTLSPREGRWPLIQRNVCAAVVLEAWALIHGKPQPRSGKLEQACADYWQACGQPEIGDHENWRRPLAQASDNYSWVHDIFLAYRGTE